MPKALRQEKFPTRLIQVVDMMLRKVLEQERPQELPLKGWPKAFKRIWTRQRKIELENFVKGWVTKEWRRVLQSKRYQSKDAVSQVAQMTTAIWETLCEPLWELRNNIFRSRKHFRSGYIGSRDLQNRYWQRGIESWQISEARRYAVGIGSNAERDSKP